MVLCNISCLDTFCKQQNQALIKILVDKQSSVGLCKQGVLKNFAVLTGKHLCQSLFFNKVTALRHSSKQETHVWVFSCHFCKIFKTLFFMDTSGGCFFRRGKHNFVGSYYSDIKTSLIAMY